MASFNKVILMGNLTRDPELRSTSGGQSVCKFSLAVSRVYKGKDGAANRRRDRNHNKVFAKRSAKEKIESDLHAKAKAEGKTYAQVVVESWE